MTRLIGWSSGCLFVMDILSSDIPLASSVVEPRHEKTCLRGFRPGFEGRMWDLIVSVPDHCLSFYLDSNKSAHFRD